MKSRGTGKRASISPQLTINEQRPTHTTRTDQKSPATGKVEQPECLEPGCNEEAYKTTYRTRFKSSQSSNQEKGGTLPHKR